MAGRKRNEKRICHADDFDTWDTEADDSCVGSCSGDTRQIDLSPDAPANPRGFGAGEQTLLAIVPFEALVPIHAD